MQNLKRYFINFKYMISRPKPVLWARTLYNYSRAIFQRRLRYVDIIVDYACNLSCEHCSCQSLSSNRETLKPIQWRRVSEEAEKLGCIIFGVQGGEPLIYPEIEKLIKGIYPHRNYISIKTNGTIGNLSYFRNLKNIGVDSITVGIGPAKDYTRNMNVLNDIRNAGLNLMLSIVISKENIESEAFSWAIKMSKKYNCVLNLALAVPCGMWKHKYDIMLTDEDIRRLNVIMQKNPFIRTDFDTNWFRKGCGGSKEKLYISPYGDVLPCPFIHISFGNVLIEPLKDIWHRAHGTKAFDEYAPVCIAAQDYLFNTYLDRSYPPVNYAVVEDLLETNYAERKYIMSGCK